MKYFIVFNFTLFSSYFGISQLIKPMHESSVIVNNRLDTANKRISKNATVVLVGAECCESRIHIGGESGHGRPEPKNGSSFDRKGERGPGSVNKHEGDREQPGSNPPEAAAPSNPSTQQPVAPSNSPVPPTITPEQFVQMVAEAPPSEITVNAMLDMTRMLTAIRALGMVMSAAQLSDLITKDPVAALEAIGKLIKGDQPQEIVDNLNNLSGVARSEIVKHALTTSEFLTEKIRNSTTKFDREVFQKERDMWNKLGSTYENVNISQGRIVIDSRLPRLKTQPKIEIIPFVKSIEPGDTYSIQFFVSDNSYFNASFSEISMNLVIEYSSDSGFKKIIGSDSIVKFFRGRDGVELKHKSWMFEEWKFGEQINASRFGIFFLRSRIAYDIDGLHVGQSDWAILKYDFKKTRFKLFRQAGNEPRFGAY